MEIVYTSIEQLNAVMKRKITSSAAQAQGALLRIYLIHTVGKRQKGKGFTAPDSKILIPFVQQLKESVHLSDKQNATLLKRIGKYADQLVQWCIDTNKIVEVDGGWMVNPNPQDEEI